MQDALKMVQRYYPKVRSVTDAKKPLMVDVTKQDCTSAKAKSFTQCAFANACKRRFDGAVISISSAYLIKGTKATRYKISNVLSREITVLDRIKRGDSFQSDSYKLTPFSKANHLGPRRYDEIRKGRHMPTHKRAKPTHTENVRHIRDW